MMIQGGEIVNQWGDIDTKLSSYTVRKSLIIALYGIYSAEGVIDVNQMLEQLGIDDSPWPFLDEKQGVLGQTKKSESPRRPVLN